MKSFYKVVFKIKIKFYGRNSLRDKEKFFRKISALNILLFSIPAFIVNLSLSEIHILNSFFIFNSSVTPFTKKRDKNIQQNKSIKSK